MKCTFIPAELARGTKALQFDVCCEAVDQNFDCGCDCYAILHLDSLLLLQWWSLVPSPTNTSICCLQYLLAVLEGLRMRLIMIHFLQLVLWHSSLLTTLYISSSYIFPVEVGSKWNQVINILVNKGSINDQNECITKPSPTLEAWLQSCQLNTACKSSDQELWKGGDRC